MYFVVTLAIKMLIYALVNSAFSGFASLKIHLFIQPPNKMWVTILLFSHPHFFVSIVKLCQLLNLSGDTLKDLVDSAEAWNGNILALCAVVIGYDSSLLVVNLNAVADNIL